ncbi:MAG: TolC family outer membrane protein [Limnobacter sp.]|nr:TolC family outer membrane protein [Limnobacter sp.]
MKIKQSILLAVFGTLSASHANALTLWDAYFLALKNDPSYKAAQADYRAGMEEGRIANAPLLPQLSLSFFQGDAKADRTQNTLLGPRTDVTDYSIKNNQIQLRQAIVNMAAWSRAKQGDLIQDQSKIKAIGSRNELATRVVSSYFTALTTLEQVELAKAQEKAATERFKEIESSVKSGESSRTDLARARAQKDLRVAERLEIQDNLDLVLRQLEDITGKTIESLSLLPSTVKTPPISTEYTYSGLETFTLRNNPKILSAAIDIQISEQEVKKRRAGHYPTLDLVASKSDSDSESINTIGQKTKQEQIALQMQIPLFSGFGTSAEVTKAKAQSDRTEAVWQGTIYDVLNKFRTQFSRTQNSLAKIEAYERAVESAREALKAAELAKKFDLQIRSDVLTAQAELNNAEKEYSRIRYESYSSLIELHSLAGKLENSDLKKLSDFISREGRSVKFDRASIPKYEFLNPKQLPPLDENILIPSSNPEKSSDAPILEQSESSLVKNTVDNVTVYGIDANTNQKSTVDLSPPSVVPPPQMRLGPRR